METQLLRRGSVELALEVQHGNPTIMLLHGLAGHGGEWSAVVSHLDDRLGVIAPDLRGHGDSTRRPGDLSRAEFIADAAVVVEQFAGGSPVVVVGHSMGGIVATLFANSRPDLVAGLMLIESGMLPMKSDELDRLSKTLLEWPAPFKDTEAAAEFFGADAAATPAWIASLAPTPEGLQPRFDVAVMVTTMEELAGSDRWDEWKSISTPTLICRADQGSITDEDISRMQCSDQTPPSPSLLAPVTTSISTYHNSSPT